MNAPLWTMESPPGTETTLNGRRYLYFAGTGYLGLQGHPALAAAARDAIDRYGIHTATSRGGFGTSPPVREVEQRAARFLGAEEAIYLVSGYAGNFAIAAALSPQADLLLIDEHAHDSLAEAARWFADLKQPPLVFRHRDANHLAELLKTHARPSCRPVVLSDGLFSLSGRLAPLADYLTVLSRYDGAMLHVDDAHGVAVLGERGRGSLELAGVAPERINRAFDEPCDGPRVFLAATLSKAIGGHGGLVAGSRAFLDRVRRSSGWLRGASAPAAPVAAATAKGLELVETDPTWRERLAANVTTLRSALGKLGLDAELSPSPIVGLRLESGPRMQAVQKRLEAAGILIAHTRDYAGAGPDGMLRIAIFATHNQAMIDRLVEALGQALAEEDPS